ncbi:MAG: hypothetical protein ACE5LU_12180 [Anaerolineae bacterium]
MVRTLSGNGSVATGGVAEVVWIYRRERKRWMDELRREPVRVREKACLRQTCEEKALKDPALQVTKAVE